ncbi:leucine-rich repeat protein [Phascolarctobacterium succinatutens]|uniref:leucine-rich repeat protein n=1 Tax=Phascolarctobacterium succinatutens TaxID=626940 RepID=UPI0026EF5AD8|nr:leucine-rich repeat protein [Phascolarctobacterium succinatutens]
MQKGITSIGKNAFWDCEYLTGVTIPEGVESIGDNAFSICKRLRRITIPDGVTHIGRDAFWNCVRLVDITLPESATSIGEGAFEDCDAIENIALPSGMTSIAADTFSSCGALKNIVIPDGVTSIGNSAFSYCGLTDIMIPENVEYIGEWAFRGCEKLESIVIPDGITSIGDYTFCECSSLTDITLPESVESIGKHAFEKSAITNITLSDNVTSIGESAFEKSKLTNIEIPDGVTRIENKTFYACDTLTDVMFSADVTFIGSGAFAQCKRLTDVYYGGSEEKWKEIDISFSNDPLINATIHYQDEEVEPSDKFTFKRDNLSFLNNRGYFFSFEDRFVHAVNQTILLKPFSESTQNTNYSYRISNEKFNQLIEGLTPATKKYITSNRFAEWGGSCRGMSTVVMLHYSYPDRIKLSNLPSVATDTVYELSSPKENSDVQDLVNYYQLAQYLPTYQLKKAKTRTDSFNNFEETLADLIAALKKQPVLIGMASNDGGHAVVFLEILEELEDYYRISIYDPNYTEPQTLVLFKTPYAMGGDEKGDDYGYMHVMYGDYKYITSYIKADDLKNLDIRSYFGMDDHEYYTNYDISYTSIAPGSDISLSVNNELYFVIKNGQIAEKNSLVNTFYDEGEDTAGASKLNITYPAIQRGDKIELELTPREDISDASILLNDTLLNVSSDGPVKLTYDESARTVDVKADDPTAVSLLMTQNTVNDSWPWHSWAVDTTGTTTLHAELDSEGLHLTGDGLTDAKYATENADTEQTSEGTINVQPDETGKTSVTIINKNDGDTDDTEVKGEDKAEETTYTVTVSGGTASPAKAKEGETVTITAEKTDTFQNWTVVAGGITLENENLPTTTFTMGKENVVITANYSSGGNITPPSPGEPGQSPSDDGGAGIVLAIGAAATVAAGIGAIALMPVKVEGKVELADHTALPGAKIALLQNGKVVAQTTTDANGKFALKVKRGSYELTAAYTDANGQLMHKTASFKAPAKNLTVTF